MTQVIPVYGREPALAVERSCCAVSSALDVFARSAPASSTRAHSGRAPRLPGIPVPTELDKMLAGQPYDPLDADLASKRARARNLCQALNATREADVEERRRLLVTLFGRGASTAGRWSSFLSFGARLSCWPPAVTIAGPAPMLPRDDGQLRSRPGQGPWR